MVNLSMNQLNWSNFKKSIYCGNIHIIYIFYCLKHMHIEISHFLFHSCLLPLSLYLFPSHSAAPFTAFCAKQTANFIYTKCSFISGTPVWKEGIPSRCKFYLKMQKPLSDIASDSWTTTGCIKIGNRPPGAVELLTTSNMASSTRPTPHSLPLKSTCWQAASASFIRCYLDEGMAENMPLICAYTPTSLPTHTHTHPEFAYQKGSWLPLRGLAQNTRYTANKLRSRKKKTKIYYRMKNYLIAITYFVSPWNLTNELHSYEIL